MGARRRSFVHLVSPVSPVEVTVADLPAGLRRRVDQLCDRWGYVADDPGVAPPSRLLGEG